jgi:hypothetical protein
LAAVKGEPSGKDIQQTLVSVLAGGTKKMRQALFEAHASLDASDLEQAFIAACRSCRADEVFAMFSPYLAAKVDPKKKRSDPAAAKREAITEVLCLRWRHQELLDEDNDRIFDKLDPRWLDLAVSQSRQDRGLTLARPGQTPGHLELVLSLARPGHAEAGELLQQAFDDRLKKSKDVWDCGQVLETMVRIQHPAATDSLIAAVNKHTKSGYNYGLYWICQMIPQLPKEAIPKLEALLPTLPEKTIDQLVDYVTQLKSKP